MADNPISRQEMFLASAAGEYSGKLPEPITREEKYLKAIAENGGGGSVDAYTKSETDTLLTAKADKATTYTKSETDARITEKVAEIVSDAPEDFDTLKEMSDWIAGHEDSAAAMNSQIQENTLAIAGKVDKVTGKGLSTEDYSAAEKAKLAGIDDYANYVAVDSVIAPTSENPVKGSVIYAALEACIKETGNMGSAVDLNNYTATQFFKVTSTQNGPPDTTYGICLVLKSSNYTAQYFLAYLTPDKNHHLYVRFYTGSWSSWKRICFYDELPTIDASLSSSSENPVQNKVIYNALYYLGTAIESRTDLNDLTVPGTYYSSSSSISGSLLNCPLQYIGFKLRVYYTSSTARIEQEIIPNIIDSTYHEIYKRSIVSGTAGDWYKFTGEVVQANT